MAMSFYAAARDENNSVNGFVFIFDMTGMTAKHLTRWKMEDIKKFNGAWQVKTKLSVAFV